MNVERRFAPSNVASRSFRGPGGTEHFINVAGAQGLDFDDQIALVERRYGEALRGLKLAPDSAVFRRLFVSDVLNQSAAIRASGLVRSEDAGPVAVSIVQQPPLACPMVTLLAYHVESPDGLAKTALSPKHVLVEKNGLGHLWSAGLCAGASEGLGSAAAQTRDIFRDLIDRLASRGGTLGDNCVRTWLYIKDVDVFYQDMVKSRLDLFVDHGLNRDTHYIASTGIEGACGHQFDLVAMDAYSVFGLKPAQIAYLNDFERLCATKDYNVTFERGTRVGYADRAHHFISGTASIDRKGQIVHPGNVRRQLGHALENVEALLRSGGGGLADMMYLIVYLRDPASFPVIADELATRFPDLPVIPVQGAVCRPGWLVEVEGVAITPNAAPELPAF